MRIEISGKEILLGHGLYFLGKAQKKYDTDLMGLLENIKKNPIADCVDLMYYSAECEAELDGHNIEITKREFLEHLEKTDAFKSMDGILSSWVQELINSIKGHFLPEDVETEVKAVKGKKKN